MFDPFAGTGSILIAAAHLGAYTLGSDIDIRVIRDGKTTSDGQVCLFSSTLAIVRGNPDALPHFTYTSHKGLAAEHVSWHAHAAF